MLFRSKRGGRQHVRHPDRGIHSRAAGSAEIGASIREPQPGDRGADRVDLGGAQRGDESGDRILADINTVEAYSKLSPEQARQFRTVYHDAAIGADSLGGVLSHLVGLVDASGTGGSFTAMHQSMIAALGMDIAATRPSTDPAKLQALVSDLYHLEVIGTTLEGCDSLAGKIEQRHGVPRFAPHQLTTDLIGLAGERWVDADHFKRLADRYKAMEPPAAMVDFLTGTRDLVKELPVKIFATAENRQSLIDAAQDAVDYSIDREEGIVA